MKHTLFLRIWARQTYAIHWNTAVWLILFFFTSTPLLGQNSSNSAKRVDEITSPVIITGVRFSYPLLQKLIDDYNKVKPSAQIIIESRGSSDPNRYDILAEVYEHTDEFRRNRQYLYVARYAILPVANSSSAFASHYAEKGLTKNLIGQLYFDNLFAEKKKEQEIREAHEVYTRLQKAGVPIVFTHYFGFKQEDIKGKAIAGSDEHLLKAILRDSLAVSYLPLTLAYDHHTRKPVAGISVLPVDVNGNGKISDDEKLFGNLDDVIRHLEDNPLKDINNIPWSYLHLSVAKDHASPEALEFLKWIMDHGKDRLHEFGYLNVETSTEKIEQFTSKLPGK